MILFLCLCICVVCTDACEQHQTCRACIRDSGACVWCPNEVLRGPRCIPEKSMPQNWCTDEIQNPKSTKTEISHQLEFSSNSDEIVQIKPQRIEMNLRPGQTINFDFSYNAAEDYPVDLYYLYDASMNSDLLEKYIKQTVEVVQWIKTVTNNASIGFGTFTDKNVLPFTSIKNESLSYSFKHQLTLSKDHETFKKVIEDVKSVSSPFDDNPNGGFDALAQVIACGEIGWRNISRKIIVFFSNNVYHAAGDGTAAGIINPYDGNCYMEKGAYAKETEMDYPSTSIINKLASEREVTIIFVIDTMKYVYDPLKKVIKGAHVIYSTITISHKETVASELKKTYESITKEIKLKVNIDPKYNDKINITFDPDCDKFRCVVEQNKEQNFTGSIKVLEFFEADEMKVNISVMGIKEKLTLDIKPIFECNCTAGDNSLCNGGGKRLCGICECNDDRTGLNCECSSENVDANNNKTTCIMPNSTIECSGRGFCICGACTCGEQRYRGRYCECDDEICPKDKESRLCGHGKCQCGECKCETGWLMNSQKTCNCDASNDQCQTGDHECSDYGRCECNACKCLASICEWDARSSQGLRCNPLPCRDCHNRQCHLLQPYALSRIKRNTPCERRINVTSVKKLGNETDWMLCSDVRSDVGCYTKFVYRYDDEKYGAHLIVQSEHNCAESAYIYGGACLGGLILIGILTLLGWKVLSVYRDRMEYRRFYKQYEEMKNSAPQENPLFNSPNRTVTNPHFRRTSIFF